MKLEVKNKTIVDDTRITSFEMDDLNGPSEDKGLVIEFKVDYPGTHIETYVILEISSVNGK